MKKNKILFYPSSHEVKDCVPAPKPAKNYNPDWYKNISFFSGKRPIIKQGQVQNFTVKSCAPFSDAMNFGYIQETWTDIYIEKDGDSIVYSWKNANIPVMRSRTLNGTKTKVPEGYYPIEFVWVQPWSPITPKGYSILYTNPINNHNIETMSTSAVVDHDNFKYSDSGQYPFFIRDGFTGIIPSGTPMFQMIPFKREYWKSKILDFDEKMTKKHNNDFAEKFWGKYRKSYRQKKSFE